MIGRDRRDPAPVVDTGSDQIAEFVSTEIGWRLDGHVGAEQITRRRNRPEKVVEARFRRPRHLRARFGPEILNNDFLDMAVAVVQVANKFKRRHTVCPFFPDPDQDSGGKRYPRLPREADRLQPRRGVLVGRSEMRATARR